jgi:hypothetical protein
MRSTLATASHPKMTPQQIGEAQELAFEWTAQRRHMGRLCALLESIDRETPERLAIVPGQVQAHAGDLESSLWNAKRSARMASVLPSSTMSP